MAVDAAPLLTRARNLAWKIETTTGTEIALSAADGVTPVYTDGDVSMISSDIETIEIEGQGSESPTTQDYGAVGATVKFQHDVYNSGTGTLPIWTNLLKASGMSSGSGGVFSPVTGEVDTLTFGYYLPGRHFSASGCMGSWQLTAERAKPARMHWTFRGKWQPPDSDTLSTPTYVTVTPPKTAITFTVAGVTYVVPRVEIDFGNEVILREDVTATDAASNLVGYRAAFIPNRRPIVRFSPESLALATKDWDAIFRAKTKSALVLTLGTGTNNVVTFAAPTMQLVSSPKVNERSGMMVDDLEFICTRNAAAGEDELTITFA